MRLKKYIQDMSIFTKIAVSTITLIILSSIASTSYQLINFTEDLKSKDRLLICEAAERIEDFIMEKYNMMYNHRTLLHSTDYIANTISQTRSNPSEIYQSEHLREITDYLVALCYSDSDIEEAILFTADGENAFSYSCTSGRKVYLNYIFNSLPYIMEFRESEDTITAVYDEAPPYITLSSVSKDSSTLSFIGKLYDMKSPTKKILLGYLMINFSSSTIDSTYNEIDASSDGEYLVVNKDSTIIYSNIPNYINQTYEIDYLNKKDVFWEKSISLSKIKVIAAVSDEVLMANVSTILENSILITVATILCLIFTIVYMHRYYHRRFNQLNSAMIHISQGDFNTRLPVISLDEIGNLSQRFNSMCETLDTYIKKTYLAETQKRTAELYALQAQINPHFLTNTIESIRMKALADDNYEIAEMLANLGNLFRWMIQFHQDIVYLDDEIEYINSYMELQNLRFGERINTVIDVPTEYLYLGIPKFTIQPIVENALTHGIVANDHTVDVLVSFQKKDENLILTVADTGTGIPPHTLTSLQRHINGIETYDSFGVALRNVHMRIQLLFGKSYGLSIDSTLHSGTTVTVTLPALPKKEMEKYVQNDHR